MCDTQKREEEEEKDALKEGSRYDRANWLAKCTFWYLRPLNSKVHHRRWQLESADFDNYAPHSTTTERAASSLETNWLAELAAKKKSGPSLNWTLLKTYGFEYAFAVTLQLIIDCILDPASVYYFSMLIDTIGHFPGGTPPTSNTSALLAGHRQAASTNGTTAAAAATTTTTTSDVEIEVDAGLRWQLFQSAAMYALANYLMLALMHPLLWRINMLALRMRVALSQLIFKKLLRIDRNAHPDEHLNDATSGYAKKKKKRRHLVAGVDYKQAISLISRDVDSLDFHLIQLPWALSGPLACLLMTGLLTQTLGYATALFSLAANGLIALQRGYMNLRVRTNSHRAARLADKRVSLITETIEAMRIVRMYAWTESFEAAIAEERRKEIVQRSYALYVRCLDNALFFMTCSGVAMATLLFGHCTVGLPITQKNVSQVFVVCSFYRRSISRYLPQGILSAINLSISTDRIRGYLSAPDLLRQAPLQPQPSIIRNSDLGGGDGGGGATIQTKSQQRAVASPPWIVSARSLSLDWPTQKAGNALFSAGSRPMKGTISGTKESTKLTSQLTLMMGSSDGPEPKCCFRELSFQVAPGELVIVAGRVGSGKSSLLQLLLSELQPTGGSLEFANGGRPSTSYASQEAWIFAGTVRDNILFGEELQMERYVRVLRACALLPDLSSFGVTFDLTLIGERGVTLSGGQRARVNLARALYRRAQIYLLDDPLSAVDAHVARHLFRDAVRGFLAGSTVFLVTHQVQYLGSADKLLLLLPPAPQQCLPTHSQSASGEHRKSGTTLDSGSHGYFGTYAQLEAQNLLTNFTDCQQATHQLSSSSTEIEREGGVKPPESISKLTSLSNEQIRQKIFAADRHRQLAATTANGSGRLSSTVAGTRVGESSNSTRRKQSTSGSQQQEVVVVEGKKAKGEAEDEEVAAEEAPNFWGALGFYLKNAGKPWEHAAYLAAISIARIFYSLISLWLVYWAGFAQERSRREGTSQLYLQDTVVNSALEVNDSNFTGLDHLLPVVDASGVVVDLEEDDQGRDIVTQFNDFTSNLDFTQANLVALGLWLILTLFACLRSVHFYVMINRAARVIHNKLLSSILYARMRFFDTTPQGHLVNRVSADMAYMDTKHVVLCDELADMAFNCSFLLLTMVLNEPKLGFVLLAISFFTWQVFKFGANLQGLLKHVDGFRRATIYSHVATTLDGLVVIRSSEKQQAFLKAFQRVQDEHTSVRFLSISMSRAICNSLDYVILVFFLALVGFATLNTLAGRGMYAFVGLQVLVQMMRMMQHCLISTLNIYTGSQALDRIREFYHLDNEQLELTANYTTSPVATNGRSSRGGGGAAAAAGQKKRQQQHQHQQLRMPQPVGANFSRGRLEFVGVSLKYGQGPEDKLVLRDISLSIEAGHRVGVVGRTGAGKSSLIACLFRLYHFEGFVFIDGQDTKLLDLQSLRNSISIIPQEPALFGGTIRANLDPFGRHPDADLWRALETVQLSGVVVASGQALEMHVERAGANFSVGQRQLICLARAILRRNKLLVLDEATANVDQATDALIQQAIRKHFVNCTVLTIAHRLNTVADSDRVLVMDGGRVAEFGPPAALMGLPNGHFASMLDSLGQQQAAVLRTKIAASSVPDNNH